MSRDGIAGIALAPAGDGGGGGSPPGPTSLGSDAAAEFGRLAAALEQFYFRALLQSSPPKNSSTLRCLLLGGIWVPKMKSTQRKRNWLESRSKPQSFAQLMYDFMFLLEKI